MIHVLIVEDDYRIAGIHEEFLEKVEGVQVVEKVLNGKEALEIIEKERIDLVLLDIYMPDILGSELLQTIRSINKQLDIIMISAATEAKIVGEVLRNGVFDYIMKPVKLERFMETMERYKEVKGKLAAQKELDQSFLDDYFGYGSSVSIMEKQTPKGIDPLTLEKIKQRIHTLNNGVTAEEMGMEIGTSRTTARRYLEYLITEGEIKAELEYGVVGRPERKYHVKK
ncbi:DNA-binding response regulator [Oceanobacillus iheyensis]|nr:DNA-binding response regulator [Oceanobacillus iheyensis]